MPLSKAQKMKNEEVFKSEIGRLEYFRLPQINLKVLVLNDKLQVTEEDVIKLKRVVTDKWIKKNTKFKINIDKFDMNSDGMSDIEREIKKEELSKVVEGHTYNSLMVKREIIKEYKEYFKTFQKVNEDVRFYHNNAQQSGVASIGEFLPQLQDFYKIGLVVRKKYSKKFIKNDKSYMMITFNSLDENDDTDASIPSPIICLCMEQLLVDLLI